MATCKISEPSDESDPDPYSNNYPTKRDVDVPWTFALEAAAAAAQLIFSTTGIEKNISILEALSKFQCILYECTYTIKRLAQEYRYFLFILYLLTLFAFFYYRSYTLI